MGAPLTLKHPDLANVREWRVEGIDNHLVHDEPRPDSVSIVRVLNAASDWWGVLGCADWPSASRSGGPSLRLDRAPVATRYPGLGAAPRSRSNLW